MWVRSGAGGGDHRLGYDKNSDQAAGSYIGVNMRKLSTAMALIGGPPVVLLVCAHTHTHTHTHFPIAYTISSCYFLTLGDHVLCAALDNKNTVGLIPVTVVLFVLPTGIAVLLYKRS